MRPQDATTTPRQGAAFDRSGGRSIRRGITTLAAVAAIAVSAAIVPGCLPDAKSEQALQTELAKSQGDATGAADSSGSTSGQCSADDMAAVGKSAGTPTELVGQCLTEEWITGCTPTAKCVGQCFGEAGTSKSCEECQGFTAGGCVASKCASPCKVGNKKQVCSACVGTHCGTLFTKCAP